jgi:hypothetical protein
MRNSKFCIKGNTEIVEFMLTMPEVNPAAGGNAPIVFACVKGHLNIVKILMSGISSTTAKTKNRSSG